MLYPFWNVVTLLYIVLIILVLDFCHARTPRFAYRNNSRNINNNQCVILWVINVYPVNIILQKCFRNNNIINIKHCNKSNNRLEHPTFFPLNIIYYIMCGLKVAARHTYNSIAKRISILYMIIRNCLALKYLVDILQKLCVTYNKCNDINI